MNTGYGYDEFTLEDNYYTDSFYNDMVNSIQIKNTLSSKDTLAKSKIQGIAEGFQDIKDDVICNCSKLARQVSICNRVIFDKTREITELKGSIYMFYILLIIAVFIIINQRMTINTLNSFIYIMKIQKNNMSISGSNDIIPNIFN
jgi:hypothetical protein